MEQVERLPPPLQKIEIPLHLSVVRLASSGPCLLRAVAPRSELPRAPSGPQAEFGKIVHALMDLAATRRLGSHGIPADAKDAFEFLLAEAASRLASNQETRRYADLSVGFTRREWEKRRFLAITGAEELVKSQRTIPSSVSAGPRAEPLSLARVLERNLPTAAEVAFESTALRIRGRLDLVALDPQETARITDFKSGSVTNADGVPNEETSLQLQLYGLALLELAPEKHVSLRVLSRDGESFVTCNDESRESALEWLRARTERLPTGSRIEAEELAVIGPQCRRCEVRPVCPAYRNSVGDLWRKTANPTELPLDVAGTVLACQVDENGYVSVKLTDLAMRVVKVHRLNPRSVFDPAPESGEVIWFFDLASIEARMQKTGWRQPRNFHEVAATSTERTAWTLRLFLA